MKCLTFRFKTLQLLFLLFVFATNVKAQTSSFKIIGYVPNWIDVNSLVKNFDFKQVTHLNYAFQNPDAAGNLVGSNTGLTALVSKAHANNVKVLISIGGGAAADGLIKTYFHNLVSTSDNRASFIHKIVLYLKAFKLDGLDVDEEGPAINSNYGAFIKQLSDSLKPKGYLLTTAVGWGSENIKNSTLLLFDFVTLMAYDYTYDFDQTRPGQHSPYWYAQKMIKDFTVRGVKKENLCLGMPFYGYGFYKSPGSYGYKTIMDKFPNAWQTDKVGDTIYYNGMTTIWKKTKLALTQTSGVMIWELSGDVTGERSLLRVIKSTVDSTAILAANNVTKMNEMNIYPNPANEYLILENSSKVKVISINIIDMNGKIVKVINVQPIAVGSSRINIFDLNQGNYIFRVISPDNVFVKLFVKN